MNAAKLGLDNLGGVFVILAGGLVLSLVMALVEFLINALINSKTDKVTLLLVYFNLFFHIYVLYVGGLRDVRLAW